MTWQKYNRKFCVHIYMEHALHYHMHLIFTVVKFVKLYAASGGGGKGVVSHAYV